MERVKREPGAAPEATTFFTTEGLWSLKCLLKVLYALSFVFCLGFQCIFFICF